MGKSFSDLVKASRTVRRFQEDEPLSVDDLTAFVNVARFAPCGNNLQLLRFHIAETEAEKKAIFARLHWAALLKDWDGPAVGERPQGYIAICAPTKMADNAIRLIDTGIAAQTMSLAATTRGVRCCMLRSFDKDVDEIMGTAEQGYSSELILAFGVAAEKVVLEDVDDEHGVAYWRDSESVHHVPKRSLEDVLI